MVVRVKLKIKGKNEEITTSTLINSGFEAEEPQLIIPLKLAEVLGLTGDETSIENFETAGGGRVSGYRLEHPIEVELILDDKPPIKTAAHISILPGETEVIMSDRLASELGIVILDAWKGYWCLREELGAKQRRSVQAEEWE